MNTRPSPSSWQYVTAMASPNMRAAARRSSAALAAALGLSLAASAHRARSLFCSRHQDVARRLNMVFTWSWMWS